MPIELDAPSKIAPLTAISVAGFKSISREQTLHLAPLTILAGANSSGKSSMMQPLLLMKQTLEAPYDPGVFLLDGPNVRFTSSRQILSNNTLSSTPGRFSISFHFGQRTILFSYKENDDFGFDIEFEQYYTDNKLEITISESMSKHDFLKYLQQKNKTIDTENIKLISFELEKTRFLLDLEVSYKYKNKDVIWIDGTYFMEKFFSSILHLSGLRGNPERTYKTSKIGKNFPGTFENYVASIIRHWQLNNEEKLQRLCHDLGFIGLTSFVSATALDATQAEIKVGRLPKSKDDTTSDLVNIADVGVGVSQTLPVLVALLAAEPGQIVYIEQPEIHLHPKAQYKLATVIAEASKRGVLAVIETHSDILIRGVQTLVAQGSLDPSLIKLHWFSRSPEDGSTTVTCAELDENGSFGDWPEDFDETALHAEKAYLDAVETRLFRHEK